MDRPAPVQLAGSLAPVMDGLEWGVGGSCLLWHLGLSSDPRDVELADGIPWMLATDWLHLYEMFERPARVAVLKRYLSGSTPNDL